MLKDQILSTQEILSSNIPDKWRPKYYLKRIGEEDILISQETRNNILDSLSQGKKFVQLGEYTIMLNAIKSIDPFWGAKNIPPKPKEFNRTTGGFNDRGEVIMNENKNPEYEEWMTLFGEKENLEIKNWRD